MAASRNDGGLACTKCKIVGPDLWLCSVSNIMERGINTCQTRAKHVSNNCHLVFKHKLKCSLVAYCSLLCQRKDWKQHSLQCKKKAKGGPADGAAGGAAGGQLMEQLVR